MVDPHCVQLPSGRPPGIPACVQSTPRLELMIPDHNWALEHTDRQSKIRGNKSDRLALITSPKTVVCVCVGGVCTLPGSRQTPYTLEPILRAKASSAQVTEVHGPLLHRPRSAVLRRLRTYVCDMLATYPGGLTGLKVAVADFVARP
jgi:hypothetical protein